ncbi:MAG: tetratricopeptide repeat protein, partial [Rhodospirillales bacterium]|nr:tetratricopeptide repeat protein [Rhodospirillales bacterium]
MSLRALAPLLLILAFTWPAQAFEDYEAESSISSYEYRINSRYGDQSDTVSPAQLWQAARQLATLGRWTEAVKAFERAIARGGREAELWLELSEAWARTPRPELWKAKAAAFKAYRLAESDDIKARALLQLGHFYEQDQQYDQAIEALGEALTYRQENWIVAQHEKLVARYSMRLIKAEAEPESERPRICLSFSRNLQERGRIRYEDYIGLEPAVEATFSVHEKRLCIEGVAHGQSYGVTLRKGLADAAGHALATQEQFGVAVPDRQPSIAFRGAAHILPRGGKRELPLDSVNVGEAELRVLRINDRNLIQEINQGRIDGLLRHGDVSRIAGLDGELIWQGSLEIENQRNRQVTTAVPVGELLGAPAPGIYAVTATSKEITEYSSTVATQWMLVSDIGMSSYRGDDGLTVFLRGLDDAKPLAGIELRLVARNNEELARAVTDEEGRVRFDPGFLRGSGGARPGAVMAFAPGGDFNFLDLTRP